MFLDYGDLPTLQDLSHKSGILFGGFPYLQVLGCCIPAQEYRNKGYKSRAEPGCRDHSCCRVVVHKMIIIKWFTDSVESAKIDLFFAFFSWFIEIPVKGNGTKMQSTDCGCVDINGVPQITNCRSKNPATTEEKMYFQMILIVRRSINVNIEWRWSAWCTALVKLRCILPEEAAPVVWRTLLSEMRILLLTNIHETNEKFLIKVLRRVERMNNWFWVFGRGAARILCYGNINISKFSTILLF